MPLSSAESGISVGESGAGRPRVIQTLWGLGLASVAALSLAACSAGSAQPPAGSSGSSGSTAAYTVKLATVKGLGAVLVNGDGRTLYALTSDQGGKITCTDASGCTAVWPGTELPTGATHGIAGSGVQGSLLGTLRSPDGHLFVSYGGWPLYTYVGDQAAGQGNGQGITSFGGTWYVINASGALVK